MLLWMGSFDFATQRQDFNERMKRGEMVRFFVMIFSSGAAGGWLHMSAMVVVCCWCGVAGCGCLVLCTYTAFVGEFPGS